MLDLVTAVGAAFGVVFVAELGDKTQLLALGYGARHSLRVVAIGLALGYGAAGALAAVIGGVLGATLPERPIAIGGGVVFLAFAVLALRADHEETGDAAIAATAAARGAVLSIAVAIAVAEMGDKTQLATATLAARASPVGTWIGATAGATTAGMIGALAGRRIGARVPERALRITSAALFAGFGVLMIAAAW
jgi:putative Ca2+/H+ antiporter (TMEM165/GDT1 family)